MKRWLRILLGLLCGVLLIIGIRFIVKGQLRKRREIVYQTTLWSYQQALKPGISRKEVEDYLRERKQTFTQTCCVDPKESRKRSWDDLVKIGAEDAPWFCSESAVYVAFQFADSSLPRKDIWSADDLDSLKSVAIYRRLEGCL
jgi:hypothetical protein